MNYSTLHHAAMQQWSTTSGRSHHCINRRKRVACSCFLGKYHSSSSSSSSSSNSSKGRQKKARLQYHRRGNEYASSSCALIRSSDVANGPTRSFITADRHMRAMVRFFMQQGRVRALAYRTATLSIFDRGLSWIIPDP